MQCNVDSKVDSTHYLQYTWMLCTCNDTNGTNSTFAVFEDHFSFTKGMACSLLGGGAAFLLLTVVLALTICCLSAVLIRARKKSSKQLLNNASGKNNGEVESYPLALRGGAADNSRSEEEQPTMGSDGGGRKKGTSAESTFKPATEKEEEGEKERSSKAKKGPYYTEVVKIRKSPKDGAEGYNKLKRASAEPALCPSSILEPLTPLGPGREGYSHLVTGNLASSSPLSPRKADMPPPPQDGKKEGGAGETVYYNEMPISQKCIYGDESLTEERGEVVQYANC